MDPLRKEIGIDQDQLELINKFDRSNAGVKKPYNISISDHYLKIMGVGSANISIIRNRLSPEHFASFEKTVVSLLDNLFCSPSSLISNTIVPLRRYFQQADTKEIEIKALSLLLEKCRSHKINSSTYSNLKTFLIHWHRLGLPGVNDDIIDFLRPLKNPKPKRPSGSPIRSDNPEEGWYTDTEYNMLVSRIWAAYEAKTNSLWNTTALLLSAQYGRRPVQIARLKIGDLKNEGTSHGVSGCRIEFPGAKDKHAVGFRNSKIEVHPMGEELWRLCQLQAAAVVNLFEKHLGNTLRSTEKKLLPLFPICTHDYTLTPCNKHADCLNCSELLLCKGHKRSIEAITEERDRIAENLSATQAEIDAGRRVASRWHEAHSQNLSRVNQLLEVMTSPSIANGSAIQMQGKDFSHETRIIEKQAGKINHVLVDSKSLTVNYSKDIAACLQQLQEEEYV